MRVYRVLLLTGLAAGMAQALWAEDTAQQAYITQYISAVNASDESAFKALLHPSFAACFNTANSEYFSDRFKKDLSRQIPEDYKLVIERLDEASIERDVRGAAALGLPYTAQPTHTMQLDYNKSEYSSVTIHRKLVLHNGTYYEAMGCPNEDILARYAKLKIKKQKRQAEALKLYEALKQNQPLYEKLSDLMSKGQKIQAYKLYSQETGESIGMAKEVLSLKK